MVAALIPAYDFQHKVKGVKDYKRFYPALRKRLQGRLWVFGRRVQFLMKREIKGWGGENSPPWKAAKQGIGVLFHTGMMQNDPKFRVYPGVGDILATCEVGFIINKPTSSRNTAGRPTRPGRTLQEVVDIVTRGREWEPTPQQRAAFWAQVPKGYPKPDAPKPSYEIPERNFMRKVRDNPLVLKWLNDYVAQATKGAWKDAGAR